MQFKIEKNVPVLNRKCGSAASTSGINGVLLSMKVGESFVVPEALRNILAGAISTLRRSDKASSYVTRKVGDSIRCWRVAPEKSETTGQLQADLELAEQPIKYISISAKLRDDLHAKLKDEAKKYGVTMAEMMGLILDNHLSALEK